MGNGFVFSEPRRDRYTEHVSGAGISLKEGDQVLLQTNAEHVVRMGVVVEDARPPREGSFFLGHKVPVYGLFPLMTVIMVEPHRLLSTGIRFPLGKDVPSAFGSFYFTLGVPRHFLPSKLYHVSDARWWRAEGDDRWRHWDVAPRRMREAWRMATVDFGMNYSN